MKLQGEHSVICLTFIKLPCVIEIFVLSMFEWPFYTGFTVVPLILRSRLIKSYTFHHIINNKLAKILIWSQEGC